MQLIRFDNVREGEAIPLAYFWCGFGLEKGKINSFKCAVLSPFKYTTEFVSPVDFNKYVGAGSNRYCWMIRRPRAAKYHKLWYANVFVPR